MQLKGQQHAAEARRKAALERAAYESRASLQSARAWEGFWVSVQQCQFVGVRDAVATARLGFIECFIGGGN